MAINPNMKSSQVSININLETGVITVTDQSGFQGQEITRPELNDIALNPEKGLRWRLSVFQFPGSFCWVVQTPGGERVYCV
jgi:hypothetical protein